MNAITSTLMTASNQWASRPADQRFTSLTDILAYKRTLRARSRSTVISTKQLEVQPVGTDHKGIQVVNRVTGNAAAPSHYSFGQLATLAKAPAGYLRTLPSEMAADCINYGLLARDVEEVGLYLQKPDQDVTLAAATGPNYGRIFDADIVAALVDRFGDGVTGAFRVPGIFGAPLDRVTSQDTTLYASDRDCFIFLADEANRIEVPGRRDGQPGSLARGFFVWNSEVGNATFGIQTFLFDYVCKNRIVWGAQDVKKMTIRHTSGAPDRYIHEVAPALIQYANSSTRSITEALAAARTKKIDDDVNDFLAARRFTRSQVAAIQATHELEEGRPIETLWDAATGITAYARQFVNTDTRIDLERQAGDIFAMAS